MIDLGDESLLKRKRYGTFLNRRARVVRGKRGAHHLRVIKNNSAHHRFSSFERVPAADRVPGAGDDVDGAAAAARSPLAATKLITITKSAARHPTKTL